MGSIKPLFYLYFSGLEPASHASWFFISLIPPSPWGVVDMVNGCLFDFLVISPPRSSSVLTFQSGWWLLGSWHCFSWLKFRNLLLEGWNPWWLWHLYLQIWQEVFHFTYLRKLQIGKNQTKKTNLIVTKFNSLLYLF